ncbi:MAG: hypothetical protein AAF125_27995 [Chloroflexota bacterium]
MPGTVEKLLDKPIVIVNYHGDITVEDTRAVFAQIAGLVETYGAPLYRITCIFLSEANTTFDEVMMMTTLSSKGISGSATDPEVFTVLVGDHPMIDLFAAAMGQEPFGAVDLPIFDTQTEALDFIDKLIEQGGPNAHS